MRFAQGDQVRHPSYGTGTVIADLGVTAVVRFAHGIEECAKEDLQFVPSLVARMQQPEWDVPLEVINRLQAEAIVSVNDAWGVFARSRIELLPHQLWVCRQVNAQWPTRWLVADDVGLGKTIEAGIILTALLATGRVKRLLVICPASLVEQWQYRLRTMFDIRLAIYSTEADTAKTAFWQTHNHVVASLETMRLDHKGRQERLLETDPWDLVLVDEAHHLNYDEQEGPTLGYQLVSRMVDTGRVQSVVFFTGTPHRGKNFGFLALLQLLRPDLFDARKGSKEQLPFLRQVMLRNNKCNVVDLEGNRLFQEPVVTRETYTYSEAEQRFYDMLSDFIVRGKAYASGLPQREGRTAMLVLIAMQKLASSSIAAIRRAIRGRLDRIREGRRRLFELQAMARRYEDYEFRGADDELSRIEEEMAELAAELVLMEDEESALEELMAAADEVRVETKIERILEVLAERFPERAVLFFSEYKATQSLLMSALIQRYGEGCVTFINGDDRADDVVMPDGTVRPIRTPRETAAQEFNEGRARFLVSTEAGGEGIDLQENCHTLIHLDLPWNPMRLHQRVGRLNRYGQTKQVEFVTIRNPATVESRIWELLEEKLHRINLAFGQAMDEPEDMLNLVLGMASPSLFRELFANAPRSSAEKLSDWFDQKTATLGGQDVVDTVRQLVGNVTKFDFKQVSDRLPRVDLPDLSPFLETALTLNGRRVEKRNGRLSFLAPESWLADSALRPRYDDMGFDRRDRSQDAQRRLLGVGHKLVDAALEQARSRTDTVAAIPIDMLPRPLIIFRARDRVTDRTVKRTIIAGVEVAPDAERCRLLLDWQLLKRLNELPLRREILRSSQSLSHDAERISASIDSAMNFLRGSLDRLDHDFRVPDVEPIAVLWTAPQDQALSSRPDDRDASARDLTPETGD